MSNISISDLKLALDQEFEVLCFEDLADYNSKQGSIFKLFKAQHRSEFTPSQRLVLYSSHELSQDFINHVQRAAFKVDISNFFILIVTPFDISDKLSTAATTFGADIPMQTQVTNITSTKEFGPPGFITHYETICTHPFMHVDISAYKHVRPCVKIHEALGSLAHNTLEEIWQNDAFKTLRQDLIAGKQNSLCKVCWDSEKLGLTSLRQLGIHSCGDDFDYSWFDETKPRVMSISAGTLCNFHCRICSPNVSSTIAVTELNNTSDTSRRELLKKVIDVNKTEFIKSIPDQLIGYGDSLEKLHLFGGEPFMWPGLDPLLTSLINLDRAKNIQINFNTNGSQYPEEIINKLQQFKKVEILISIDDVGERFEVQRGGSWQEVCENVLKFGKLKSENFIVKISPTVNIQNLFYLNDLLSFCQNNDFEIVWWYLERPPHMSIHNVTQKVKDIVRQKYKDHPNSELRNICNMISQSSPVSGAEFIDYMLKRDSWFAQSFQLTHKEIFDAMQD